MKSIQVDGAKIAFHDVGTGTPLLLLHGFPLTSESFKPQLDALSKKFRMIAPDHRGFGESGDASGPLEMSRIARDALAVLNSLKIDRAIVGGVSMGGYAALALVREDAGRVAGLLMIDTQAGADDEAGKAKREETAKAVEAKGVGVLVEGMLPKLVSEQAPQAVKQEIERIIRSNRPSGCAAALRGMALRPDSKDMLARFAGKALFIVGEKDPITPRAKTDEMARLVPGSKVVELKGVGHLANSEAPGLVNAEIERFFG